jgi:hypothetical protein
MDFQQLRTRAVGGHSWIVFPDLDFLYCHGNFSNDPGAAGLYAIEDRFGVGSGDCDLSVLNRIFRVCHLAYFLPVRTT